MLVSADAGLIHPGDQRRAACRAHGCRDERIAELRSLAGEAVHVRRLDCHFAIARKVGRHVIDDEPQDVRLFSGQRADQQRYN
jgi:hypothetical protein